MDRTNPTLILGGLALLTAAGLAALAMTANPTDTAPDGPETFTLTESFEDNPTRWHERASVPEDPNTNGTVAWSIEPNQQYAADGNTSMLYRIDGNQDDGTIWLQTNMSIEEGHRYNVTMEADAWSQSESFNKLAQLVMLTGTDVPENETGFPQSGSTWTSDNRTAGGLRADLDETAGWKTYRYSWQTPELQQDHLVVAVGISVIWETQLAYPIDAIEVTAEPLEG
jgi:hypothetical protein